MEQYADVQQLLKKEDGQNRKPIYPPTVIQAVFDGKTGASLEAILAQFNSIYVQYQGTPEATRNIIPVVMRRPGLTITYMNMESETITERANSAVQKDNDHWGLDVNWNRVDELSLSGDISVSAKGTWIINGKDTGVKALGPKGDTGLTPWLKTIDNKLHFSYDNVTWEPCSENIAAWFRWNDNKIQISRDNKTWTDLSGKFADNVHIKGYVANYASLPSGAVQGDIYGVGPTYAAEDTAHSNPIYRYYVRNANSWVDNGSFTSISAGVVQETGNSETEVMSQKAVSTKLFELGSEIGSISLELNNSFDVGTDVTGYKTEIFKCQFKFVKGEKYIVENISVSGKGISVNLYNEQGDVIQSVGTVNPTPKIEFVAEEEAEYIGGYGSAWKARISIADTLEDKAEKGAETHSFVIGAENEVTYESEQGVFLNYNNGLKSNAGENPLAVSKPIPVSKGQLVVAELSTLYNFVSAIAVTNADGTSHKMVVKGNGKGVCKYFYIADRDGYIEVCFDYRLDNKVYISDSSLSQLIIETILSNSNSLPPINIGVDGDSITEGNQWSYYAAQILGANQYNVGVGSACWTYKDKYALDGVTIMSPQHYTDENFVGFGGASNLDSDEKIQMWVNNNACTHIEKFVALVADGTYPTPDVFVFAMGTNADTSNNNSNGSIDEAMSAKSINDSDFVNENGKSLKYTMCGAMRWCIETIKRNYPNCKVFVSLPIQRASYELNKDYLYPKVQLIKDMAIQMGCQIIDQYNGCGITSAIENDSSPYGPYLRDGLHPNTDGQKLMGAFAASQIKAKYFAV